MAKAYPTLCLDPFPAFYVPTGARAATRASIPTSLPSTEFTLAATLQYATTAVTSTFVLGLRTSVYTLPLVFVQQGGVSVFLTVAHNGVQSQTSVGTLLAGVSHRLVFAAKSGTILAYLDGALKATVPYDYGSSFALLEYSSALTAAYDGAFGGVVLANHAWSAAEVAADLANPNPPGIIANGGLFSQPGALYTQTPDATGNSLALPPPTGGRVVPDVIHTGVVRAGSLQPLTGQSTVGVQGAVFDAAGLLQAGGLKHIGATVGTSQVAVAHGLGRVPSIVLFFERSNATSWQSATADSTNVYLTASVAATSVDLYVA